MATNFTRANNFTGNAIMVFISVVFILTTGCAKEEGPGGTGSISGRITGHYFNDDYSMLIYQEHAVDEEVFIVYGDEGVLGDRTFTGPTGLFRFDFLYPGQYEIYYFSRDSTSVLDEKYVKTIEVELNRGEEKELGDLVKLDVLDFDDGAAVIKGKVRLIQYAEGSQYPDLVIEYIDDAHEKEVYLTYGNHTFYDERIRTQQDGTFEFRGLIPGDYLVVLYSDDVTGVLKDEVLTYQVTITGMDQVVDLGQITIKNL